MKYFAILDDLGFVSRVHPCDESELEFFQRNPAINIEIDEEQSNVLRSRFDGRWRHNGTSFVFIADAANLEIVQAQVLGKRSNLLKETDWTQLPDVPPLTQNKWIAYRQLLRDITKQSGYPFNIIWPEIPN